MDTEHHAARDLLHYALLSLVGCLLVAGGGLLWGCGQLPSSGQSRVASVQEVRPAHNAASQSEPALAGVKASGSGHAEQLLPVAEGALSSGRCRRLKDRPDRPAGLWSFDHFPRRRVVLTFDDGPLYYRTPRILDALAKHRLQATFFVVGKMINASTYRIVQRIVREGHILANHSYHHRTTLARHKHATAIATREFLLTQAMVDIALLARSRRDFRRLRRRLLGGETGQTFIGQLRAMWPAVAASWRTILRQRGRSTSGSPYRMVYTRPPGGDPFFGPWKAAHKLAFARAIRQAGLVNVMWTGASADSDFSYPKAARRDPKTIADTIIEAAARGGILLMHDWTPLAGLERGLERLSKSSRLSVVTLDHLAERKFHCSGALVAQQLQRRAVVAQN